MKVKQFDKNCIGIEIELKETTGNRRFWKHLTIEQAENLANDLLDAVQYGRTHCDQPLIQADFDCVNCVRWQDDCEGVENA